MSTEENSKQTEIAHDTASRQGEVLDLVDSVLVPDGYRVQSMRPYFEVPARVIACDTFSRLDSLIGYLNRHPDASKTVVWADEDKMSLVAILNDIEPLGVPQWRDWRAVYKAPLSPEFRRWKEKDGKSMSQINFAMFIEDNLLDITSPSGSDMLRIAKSLHATRKVDFKSDTRLENGDTQFKYEQETVANTKGGLIVPDGFKIGIPVFQGGPKYEIECRFRYRLEEARLTFWYELVRIEKVTEHAFAEVVETVKKGVTDLTVFYGTPGGL